jgi:hypothetical protein
MTTTIQQESAKRRLFNRATRDDFTPITLMVNAGPCTFELKAKGLDSRAFDVVAVHYPGKTAHKGNPEQFVGITFFHGDPVGYWSKGFGPIIQGRLNRA